MVGAGVPMLLDTSADRTLVTPRHQGIDKPVGASTGEIGVAEALTTPVVHIIFELKIARERLPSSTTRPRRVGFQHHPNLRAQQLAGAEDRAGLRGVLRSRIVGVGAIGELAR